MKADRKHPSGKVTTKIWSSQVAAAMLYVFLLEQAVADPPDIFNTIGQLRRETSSFEDPLGHDCILPTGPLTFSAAVQLALCKNPQTRSAWSAAHQQAAVLGGVQSTWLPTLSGAASESRYFGTNANVSGETVSGSQNSIDAALNLSWTLYDFGARSGRIESARKLLDAAAATVNSVAQQLVRLVVQAYYGVVAGDATLSAAKTTEDTTAKSLEVARSLRDGGVGTMADVLQAETAHDQAILTRVQADAAAKSARGALAVTLGLTADQGFVLAPEPIPTEVPELSAKMSELMNEAARQRPDLAAAEAQRDSAMANVRVARAAGLPVITIGASHNFIDTNGAPNQNYNQIGINITVPIFTGFAVGYGVRQAQAALDSSEANLNQTGLSVTLDVWNGYYGLDSANKQLTATAALAQTAEDNMRVALGRYQAGVGSIVDVLTAQTAAATARVLRINAELGWKIARAQLALALGRLSRAEPIASDQPLP